MKNEFLRLTNPLETEEHWDFFHEGMTALNNPKGANAKYTNETFFRLICNVVGMGEQGLVVIIRSKDGKDLAFCVAFETINFMAEKCVYLVEIYSNGTCDRATKDALQYIEQHTRKLGLNTIKAATRRFTGSSLRLFEDRWGFKREYQTFTKTI